MPDAPVIPLADAAFWQDPYPVLARLREEHRTAATDAGTKAVLRFADCEALLKSGDFENEGLEFIAARGFAPGDPLWEWRRSSLGALNGAPHARLRALVSRALTHRSVDALRPRIRAHARALLDAHRDAGQLDVVADFARRLPFLAITDFLGIELGEALEVAKRMGSGAVDAFGPNVTPEVRATANATFAAMMEFVGELYERRRAEPRDDLLGHLIAAEDGGDALSHHELVVLFSNLFGGAIETTASVIASGALELTRHPEAADALRRDPERWKRSTAEEVLRMRPGFFAIGKKAVRAHRAFGLDFAAGEPVAIPIGAPNRDPRRYPDPDRFDPARDPRQWSLTFSLGDHFCLGQALARCELQEALATLVATCDDLELLAEPRWTPRVTVHRMEALPLRFAPRTPA
ncbi:MAG: cytochrome P450 [Myxococcota bacterium]|nr:cytochrome P450 [Myxococcales bacterium]